MVRVFKVLVGMLEDEEVEEEEQEVEVSVIKIIKRHFLSEIESFLFWSVKSPTTMRCCKGYYSGTARPFVHTFR